MHASSILLFLSASLAYAGGVQGSRYAGSALLNDLSRRQFQLCSSVPAGPNLCERSCGAGYEACVTDTTCYNPGQGDTCCSDGTYCLAGESCTSTGCCPDGETCNGTPIGTIAPVGAGSGGGSGGGGGFTSTFLSTSTTIINPGGDFTITSYSTTSSTDYFTNTYTNTVSLPTPVEPVPSGGSGSGGSGGEQPPIAVGGGSRVESCLAGFVFGFVVLLVAM